LLHGVNVGFSEALPVPLIPLPVVASARTKISLPFCSSHLAGLSLLLQSELAFAKQRHPLRYERRISAVEAHKIKTCCRM
jgi:hypothetical protein